MAVAIRVIGSTKRINHNDDDAMLALCKKVSVGKSMLKMITLKLHNNVVRGGATGKYRMRGFQTVDVIINASTGAQNVKFTKDSEGKDTSILNISFTPDGYGGRYAHVPDTAFNRDVLVKTFGKKFIIADEDVAKEVEKLALARIKRRDNAMETALEKATKMVNADKATLIKGLKDKLGAGFEGSNEYKENVGQEINRIARKIFVADKGWETAKAAPKVNTDKK